jgi:hypothetical protein
VLSSLDGQQPEPDPSPEELGAVMDRIGRAQAVKCSPLTHLSRPSEHMKSACPSRYLAGEIVTLKPGAIVALGNDARWSVEQAGTVNWRLEQARLKRGTLSVGYHSLELFGVAHPTAHGRIWTESYAALLQSLATQPLRAA